MSCHFLAIFYLYKFCQHHSHHHHHSIINLAVFSWKLSAWVDHEGSRRTDMCFGFCRSTCGHNACGKYSQRGYLWWAFGLTDTVVNHSKSKTPPCESFKHPPSSQQPHCSILPVFITFKSVQYEPIQTLLSQFQYTGRGWVKMIFLARERSRSWPQGMRCDWHS